jgi:hypothetical protein
MDNDTHKYLSKFPCKNYRMLQNFSAYKATFIQVYFEALPENYRNGRGILIPRFLRFNRNSCDSSNFILRVGSNADIIGYQIPL